MRTGSWERRESFDMCQTPRYAVKYHRNLNLALYFRRRSIVVSLNCSMLRFWSWFFQFSAVHFRMFLLLYALVAWELVLVLIHFVAVLIDHHHYCAVHLWWMHHLCIDFVYLGHRHFRLTFALLVRPYLVLVAFLKSYTKHLHTNKKKLTHFMAIVSFRSIFLNN